MKVLIVDPDTERVPPLQQALAAVGAEVALAPSGSFALTMLEWNRQDVIVSRPLIGDMDAIELCSIVRADPATREVRFVLVAGTGEIETDRTTAAGVDLVLPSDMTATMILTLVTLMRCERERPKPPPAPPLGPSAPSPPPQPPSNGTARPVLAPPPAALVDGFTRGDARTFQGSLGVVPLADVAQAVAAGARTGRLIVAVGGAGGLVAFDQGQPVHAEYREESGESALTTMMVTAHREGAGRFCFIPGESVAAGRQRTIDRALPEVLLDIAAAIGAGAAATTREPGAR